MREVIMQAMINTAISQMTVDLVQSIPIPDLGHQGKALAAKGGGVIFGMSLFARQGNFRAKVAALAVHEDSLDTLGTRTLISHRRRRQHI